MKIKPAEEIRTTASAAPTEVPHKITPPPVATQVPEKIAPPPPPNLPTGEVPDWKPSLAKPQSIIDQKLAGVVVSSKTDSRYSEDPYREPAK